MVSTCLQTTLMHTVKLEHNDDEVLDPADPQLVVRGSLFIDGHDAGCWEERRDGTWAAHVRHKGGWIVETSRGALIERLARGA
ncbi:MULTISPECIES: hypothetical protein [Caballeronia]|jgi:hypothetical protein|nr:MULTISPECIES: hypothetical protein [Caballeronia]MCG7402198.1 hypothetical protein [Caballeronia zhejiangensis]MCI1042395.1 hypothetical protein [Caballeronia zhejiangensis]MDR5768417.1 hypothetical protein [Caballeronia sp. LZ028]MDR5789814.1 hypothetical protein [Caballeronia sp. LP003]MDR5797062.1 hypothetical protein [Caballeronia sp. LZ008]